MTGKSFLLHTGTPAHPYGLGSASVYTMVSGISSVGGSRRAGVQAVVCATCNEMTKPIITHRSGYFVWKIIEVLLYYYQ